VIPFARERGLVTASFTNVEVGLITDLAASIAQLLENRATSAVEDPLFDAVGLGGSDTIPSDPALARLLPDAYKEDLDASREFRQFTERSLAARKVANARVVIESLERDHGIVELDDAAAQSWLRALSDIRLAIASRLCIEQDDDDYGSDQVAGDHTDRHGTANGETASSDAADDDTAQTDETLMLTDVYDWLAYVLGSLIDAVDSDASDPEADSDGEPHA
jgi:hypothetical protein